MFVLSQFDVRPSQWTSTSSLMTRASNNTSFASTKRKVKARLHHREHEEEEGKVSPADVTCILISLMCLPVALFHETFSHHRRTGCDSKENLHEVD